MKSDWQLHLYGDFRLFDGSGSRVRLPNAKVEALLAVLAVERRFGLERDEVAEILWPGRPIDAQRANLRQTLSLLRKALGHDSIESSRTHCRLGGTFVLQCDHDEWSLRGGGAFMPGHEGDWFEEFRLEADLQSANSPRSNVVHHYLQTLRWYAERSPRNMYALLRANASLVRGMEYPVILGLLEGAGPCAEWQGWASYWRGTAEEDLEACARHLRKALEEANRTEDHELASEVCLELGKVYARTGRFKRAELVCSISTDLVTKTSSRSIKANAHRLQGNVLVQRSAGKDGFDHMRRAEDLMDDPVERAILQSGRAFFEASAGRLKDASESLADVAQFEQELGHRRIAYCCRLTRALLAAHGGSRPSAVDQLETVADDSQHLPLQMLVYVEELLAKLFYLSGDKGTAQRKLRLAADGRRESRMAVTPLEAKRLQAVQ